MKSPPPSAWSLFLVIAVAGSALGLWQAHVESRDARRLAERVKPGDIRMLSSETCPYCLAARRWMTAQRVPFRECFIERDAACAADYQALGAAGTPTLVVRGQRVIGFDRERILNLLDTAEPSRQRWLSSAGDSARRH